MHKYVYFIVIMALLLTAPLSFTGDKCPDFRPDVELQQTTPQTKTVAANTRKLAFVVAVISELPEAEKIPSISTAKFPSKTVHQETIHDRAPPQV